MQPKSFAQRMIPQAKDIHEYNQLKEAHEKEVEATRKLFEHLRRELGSDEAAKAALKQRGYDCNLLK